MEEDKLAKHNAKQISKLYDVIISLIARIDKLQEQINSIEIQD